MNIIKHLKLLSEAEYALDEWSAALEASMRETVIREYLMMPRPSLYPCGCMGPQDGDPVCPCSMRSVVTIECIGGKRYFRVNEVRKELSIDFEITEIFGSNHASN